MNPTKKCPKCQEVKPRADFYQWKHKSGVIYCRARCKPCMKKDDNVKRRLADPLIGTRPRPRREGPPKWAIYKQVERGIKRGVIVKPTACQQCGQVKALHGHHGDYAKPLDLIWLCHLCHGNIHQKAMFRTI